MKIVNGVVLAATLGILVGATSSADALGRRKGGGSGVSYTGSVRTADNHNNNGTNPLDEADDLAPLDDVNSNPVPEPATGLLFGAGALGLAGYRKIKKRFAKKSEIEVA